MLVLFFFSLSYLVLILSTLSKGMKEDFRFCFFPVLSKFYHIYILISYKSIALLLKYKRYKYSSLIVKKEVVFLYRGVR